MIAVVGGRGVGVMVTAELAHFGYGWALGE